MTDDTEDRSAEMPISDAPEDTQERADAPEGTHERDGDERSSNQSHMRFDESPGRFLASRGQAQFAGSSGMLFEQAMAQTRMAICLTDPNQKDDPIVFCNEAFQLGGGRVDGVTKLWAAHPDRGVATEATIEVTD